MKPPDGVPEKTTCPLPAHKDAPTRFQGHCKWCGRKLPHLLPRWLPDGRRVANEWLARDPTRPDRTLGSFKVNLKSGCWADFATGDAGSD